MLDRIQITARELVIENIEALIQKYEKKAEKEKAKRNKAYVTYKGEKYYSESELQNAYGCDVFSCATFDRLSEKLSKAKGCEDYEYTESEKILMELRMIQGSFKEDLRFDAQVKQRQEQTDKRASELAEQGYSVREIETIIGNEELMRYE